MALARSAKKRKLGRQSNGKGRPDETFQTLAAGISNDWDLQTPGAGPSTISDDNSTLRRSGRSRTTRLPPRFEDFEISSVSAVIRKGRGSSALPLSALATPRRIPSPQNPSPLPESQHDPAPQIPTPANPLPLPTINRVYYKTQPNELGIYRVYDSKEPSRYPEDSQFVSSPNFTTENSPDASILIQKSMALSQNSETGHQKKPLVPPPYAPLPNVSTFRLFDWAYETTSVTEGSLSNLVNNVILQPDFDPSHFRNFSARRELQKLDAPLPSAPVKPSDKPIKPSLFTPQKTNPTPKPSKTPPFAFDNSVWHRGTLSIPMPCVGHKHTSESDAPQLIIDNVWYRKPLSIIHSLVKDEEFLKLHLRPYKEFWLRPSASQPHQIQRVYGEAFTSNCALRIEREKLKRLELRGIDDGLETVIIWMMMASDSTHLANFGTASSWPIYMYIGNRTKYERGNPKFFTAHHLAYIPQIPDMVQDVYREAYKSPPSDEVIKHLKREVMQAIWSLIMDDEFLDAYEKSVIYNCADKVKRRFLPEFFSYSADYPEK
ncbi:hypothetical protein AAF712_016188 [Marasmius tenuissimus]|uniref:Uncharacterized protein n=1 Tax=Marasmius tenuissimus TaxID=585030 RepID=A0ABR2Z7D6_9AGAR